MPSLQILVIDDEPAVRQILAAAVTKAGHAVTQAATVADAASKLVRGDIDVALCDIKMPDGNGIDLMRNSQASGIETAFIMITGFGSIETAVEALRAGAFDYMVKPVQTEELLHRVSQVEALGGLREENKALRQAVRDSTPQLYGFKSCGMRAVERLIHKVAPTDSTVLITGESGTGKGVVARAIHDRSGRSDHPYLHVNCSAIPEQLLESEFFGHTKGAFTSADRARKGLFLQADKGTLFLDEIGELPLHMQAKLLHVIEDKEIRPIGSEQVRRVDTRIITATNRDLAKMVAEGKFREDLYFRLNMFHVSVPPLRERKWDIHGFIRFVLARGKGKKAPAALEIDPLVEEALLAYSWPGNVREFENVMNSMSILADGDRLTIADLPPHIAKAGSMTTAAGVVPREGMLRDQLRQLEANLILQAVEDANGDRRLAAQRLGIGLSSLYRKLEELGVDYYGQNGS